MDETVFACWIHRKPLTITLSNREIIAAAIEKPLLVVVGLGPSRLIFERVAWKLECFKQSSYGGG
jgi:hypothetical protein